MIWHLDWASCLISIAAIYFARQEALVGMAAVFGQSCVPGCDQYQTSSLGIYAAECVCGGVVFQERA
jgi:hypothetical protein